MLNYKKAFVKWCDRSRYFEVGGLCALGMSESSWEQGVTTRWYSQPGAVRVDAHNTLPHLALGASDATRTGLSPWQTG
jgi:hypothetical protein